MKKNALTTALVAGIAGVAGLASVSNAVNLNPDGLGQVLVYPYYTVQANNQTLLSVVNTTNRAKSVKVRFLEGRNSREVLDFNLYLSEFDVWTAVIGAVDATGPAYILTDDNSCTVPQIKGNTGAAGAISIGGRTAVPFRNFAYTSPSDGGGSGLDRTREGHFEMIEMGTLIGASASAARHNNGTPSNCGTLRGAWATGGYWTVNGNVDHNPPSGGLFGAATIINVPQASAYGYNADAIDGWSVRIRHTQPSSLSPTIADANTDPVDPTIATSYVIDGRDVIDSDWVSVPSQTTSTTVGARVDAVSSLYMHNAIQNEFVTEGGVFGGDDQSDSEWVITFPTKRFYVDPQIVGGGRIPPFRSVFGSAGACEPVSFSVYDREERTFAPNPDDFSPRPIIPGDALCWEAQVVSYNDEATPENTDILGSRNAYNLNTGTFQTGWISVIFTNADQGGIQPSSRLSDDGDRYTGLPVTGFWLLRQVNNQAAPGSVGIYGSVYRHRGSRSICTSGC